MEFLELVVDRYFVCLAVQGPARQALYHWAKSLSSIFNVLKNLCFTIQFYNSTNSVEGLWFLHILTRTHILKHPFYAKHINMC